MAFIRTRPVAVVSKYTIVVPGGEGGRQGIRILLGENFQEIVSFPTSSFTFGSSADFGTFLSA